jgi:hypothetical protein
MSSRPPSGQEAVQLLAARLGQAISAAVARAGGAPVALAESRGVRSTWGQFRPTLSRAARALVLPGVPGGVVIDPDQVLALQQPLVFAVNHAVQDTLTPRDQGGASPPAPRVQLSDDLSVLVLAYELRQGREAWRLRVCLPANTLMAVLQQLSSARPTEPQPDPAASPRTEVLREIARQDPRAVTDLLRRWLAEDP